MPGAVNECVKAAYGLMCDLLWRPVFARLTYGRKFKKLQQMVAENKQTEEGLNLRWEYSRP